MGRRAAVARPLLDQLVDGRCPGDLWMKWSRGRVRCRMKPESRIDWSFGLHMDGLWRGASVRARLLCRQRQLKPSRPGAPSGFYAHTRGRLMHLNRNHARHRQGSHHADSRKEATESALLPRSWSGCCPPSSNEPPPAPARAAAAARVCCQASSTKKSLLRRRPAAPP